MSADEDFPPTPTASGGLFDISLFSSLLHKAKVTAGITTPPPAAASTDPLFSSQAPAPEAVPAPQIFVDTVTNQWSNPSSSFAPGPSDRRLFAMEDTFLQLLEVPSVDPPVAALYSPNTVPGDAEELLKPEERKIEQATRRAHQAAAWAVRASSTASFFNRTALKWLKQLKEHLPSSDTRAQQDITKLIAATQLSADATLQASRFASRAIVQSVVGRRMLWLRQWQADTRYKWRLASSPFQGKALFGAPLEPLLIENKDKKKVLPAHSRRGGNRQQPQRKAARAPDQFPSTSQRGAGQYTYRPRQNQDRYQCPRQPKKPFRGGRYQRRPK